MKGIYFASFYFRVWDLTREIRENKNPAKISTYTVFDIFVKCIMQSGPIVQIGNIAQIGNVMPN